MENHFSRQTSAILVDELGQYIVAAHKELGTVGIKMRFENNLGLSIIKGEMTYTGDDTFEVAVIKWDGDKWDFLSDRLNNQVRGWMTVDDVRALALTVKSAPVPFL